MRRLLILGLVLLPSLASAQLVSPLVPQTKGMWICSMVSSLTFTPGSGYTPGSYKAVPLTADGVPQMNEPLVNVTVGPNGSIAEVAVDGAGQDLRPGMQMTGKFPDGKTFQVTIVSVGHALWGAKLDDPKDIKQIPSIAPCQAPYAKDNPVVH